MIGSGCLGLLKKKERPIKFTFVDVGETENKKEKE